HVALEADTADVVVHGDDVRAALVVDEVVAEGGGERRRRALLVAPGRQLDVVALQDRVTLDERIPDLAVAIDRRVRHAVHDHERAAEPGAGEAVEIVVADDLPLVDEPDTTGVGLPVAEERVVLDDVAVAVAQRQRAAGLEEHVAPKRVAARFARDDLDLAVAVLEPVVLHDRERVAHGVVAGADAEGLAAVGAEYRPRPEPVVIDAVMVLDAFGA